MQQTCQTHKKIVERFSRNKLAIILKNWPMEEMKVNEKEVAPFVSTFLLFKFREKPLIDDEEEQFLGIVDFFVGPYKVGP